MVRIRQHSELSTQQQRADDEASTGTPEDEADNDGENCWSYEQVGKHGCCTLGLVHLTHQRRKASNGSRDAAACHSCRVDAECLERKDFIASGRTRLRRVTNPGGWRVVQSRDDLRGGSAKVKLATGRRITALTSPRP